MKRWRGNTINKLKWNQWSKGTVKISSNFSFSLSLSGIKASRDRGQLNIEYRWYWSAINRAFLSSSIGLENRSPPLTKRQTTAINPANLKPVCVCVCVCPDRGAAPLTILVSLSWQKFLWFLDVLDPSLRDNVRLTSSNLFETEDSNRNSWKSLSDFSRLA